MRPSIRLPRQQRPKGGTNRFSGGSSHQALPEAKSLRRDDGPGQAVTRVVDTSSDVITLSADWPTCSSMNPIRRRPRADPVQKQVTGEWITQKGIDSSRPVTVARMKRGELRGAEFIVWRGPGFRFAHPGYSRVPSAHIRDAERTVGGEFL